MTTAFKALALAFASMWTVMAATPVLAQGKHALLVGNSQYEPRGGSEGEGGSEHWTVLPNPTRDVEMVASSLRAVGWEVTVVSDGSWQEMDTAIDRFSNEVADAEIVLFYFAGHGFEYDRRNYLVPVDAPLSAGADELPDRFIEFERLAEKLIYDGTVIFMLDACRTGGDVDPLPASAAGREQQALQRSAPAPVITEAATTRQASSGVRDYDFPPGASVAVLYSTGRGIPAYDSAPPPEGVSPFAYEVANLVRVPKVDVSLVFNSIRQGVYERTQGFWPPQVPFTYNSLAPGLFFSESEPVEPLALAVRTPADPSDTVPKRRGAPGRKIDVTLEDLQRIDEPILLMRVLARHSVDDLRAMDAAGDPLATHFLGYMQRFGLGVEKDMELARATLERSAALGTPYGQLELADFLRVEGDGPQDYARSVELYRAAAEQDFAKAQAQYGRVLIGGIMVEKSEANDAAGYEQLLRSAKGGYAFAYYGLWTFSEDPVEKQRWVDSLIRLSEAGRTDADQQLCAILVRDQQYAASLPYCEVAAQEGYPDAFGYLARAADEGWGGERSVVDAKHYMRQALSRGDLSPGLCSQMLSMQYLLAVETNTLDSGRITNCSRGR